MKPVYRVLSMVEIAVSSEAMFTYRAFWQFCLSALFLTGGFVLFGENYK